MTIIDDSSIPCKCAPDLLFELRFMCSTVLGMFLYPVCSGVWIAHEISCFRRQVYLPKIQQLFSALPIARVRCCFFRLQVFFSIGCNATASAANKSKEKKKSIEKPEGQIQSFHFSNFRSSLFGKIEIVQTVGLKMIKILFGWLNVNFLSLSSAYVLYIILWYCFGPNVAVLFVCRRVPSSQEYFA